MKSKQLIILMIVAMCLGLAAYWTTAKKQRSRVAAQESMGALVLPQLAEADVLNSVGKIVVETASSTVTVAKVDDLWVVPDKENYPANFDRIREFLQGLSALKVGQTVKANTATLEKLGLTSFKAGEAGGESLGLLVTLWDAGGNPVAALRIGKEHLRSAPEGAGGLPMGMSSGYPDGRYVAVEGKAYLVTETFAELSREALGWLDNTLLNVDPSEIVELTVSNRTDGAITLSRPGAESVFVAEGLKEDEQTNAGQASELASLFSRLSFTDVRGESVDPATAGFSEPTLVTARTQDGEIYQLQIGGSPESSQDRYARITVSLDQEAVAKSTNTVSETDATQLGKEVEQYNQKLSKWTYVVPSYRLNGSLGGRAQLVTKKGPAEPVETATSAAVVSPTVEEAP